ncbi:F0F1 ATP synthase subunit delta [Candidatus Saccharibacteria bacterium]|nr:F0F1 ATP synthase subunit delta [Candidatus Saccharibacteria bacterium]
MSATTIAGLIDQDASSRGIAKKIASYLIDTKQTLKLDSLMRDVMSVREAKGTYEINVSTAHPLTSAQTSSISAYIKKHFDNCKDVIIHQKVDPTLLGGVRIESAHYLIDKSVKSELNYIKSSIEK